MRNAILSFCLLFCSTTVVFAQNSTAGKELFPVAQADPPPVIITNVAGAWKIECLPDTPDICNMVQIAKNQENAPVLEVRVQKLPENNPAVAGITVVAPLGTLLPELLTIRIDEADSRRYNFAWCDEIGCIARFGFTDIDIDSLKLGANMNLRLVSIFQPDQPLSLDLSLDGFTAAWETLKPFNPEVQ